jgi:hypothetical protein
MTTSSTFKPKWKLEVLDDPTRFVEGQFIPTEFEEGVSTNFAHTGGFGSEDPVTQWVNGKLDTISFTARLYAASFLESVTAKLETLKGFVRKEANRRSPPPLLFTWGREISRQCVLTSLGGIRYDDIHIDGHIRGVVLQVQLVEYREYQNAVEALTGGESFVHISKDGDTFESIALFHFDRPDWGDLIRGRNPQYAPLDSGSPIEIPEAWVLRAETVTPRSIPFRRKALTNENRKLIFDSRKYTYISHV